MKILSKNRRFIQLFFAIIFFYALVYYQVSLWVVLMIATVLGFIFGKFFCKWMCPMGLIMELMTRNMTDDEKKNHMYNYYKLGCPISWIQGLQNRFSFFKIINNKATCVSCGKCDEACYITNLNIETSLYKEDHKDPATAFRCSKCMACVDSCPNGSLKYRASLKNLFSDKKQEKTR